MIFYNDTVFKLYGRHGREGGFYVSLYSGQGVPKAPKEHLLRCRQSISSKH